MDKTNETLGRRIARLRLEYGMTQERLAMKMGVTAQAVSKWENDLSAPDIMLLPELARTLGVTVDELLEAAHADKKRRGDAITLIQPEVLGRCGLYPTNYDELRRVLELGMPL